MFSFLRRIWPLRRPNPPRILVDSEGFVVQAPNGRALPVRWSDVVAVFAYKRDLLSTDEVVLAFRRRQDPELVLEVSEEWPGFRDLFRPLENNLGITDAWYFETTAKPFETDFRTLLDRRAPVT
jgi:hypothetical protein